MIFSKDRMLKRLEKAGMLNQVTKEATEIMDDLDGHTVQTQCWRRQVYGEPVYWCEGEKHKEYVHEDDCI